MGSSGGWWAGVWIGTVCLLAIVATVFAHEPQFGEPVATIAARDLGIIDAGDWRMLLLGLQFAPIGVMTLVAAQSFVTYRSINAQRDHYRSMERRLVVTVDRLSNRVEHLVSQHNSPSRSEKKLDALLEKVLAG